MRALPCKASRNAKLAVPYKAALGAPHAHRAAKLWDYFISILFTVHLFNHCLHAAHFHCYLHEFKRTGIMSPTMPTTVSNAIVSCLVGCCHVAEYVCFPCLYVDERLQGKRNDRRTAIARGERPPPTSALVSLPPRRPMTPPLPAGVTGAHTDPQISCALFTKLPYELREMIWNEYLSGFRFHLHNTSERRGRLEALMYRNQHDFPWSYP